MGHGAFTMLSSIVLWKNTDVCGRVSVTVVVRFIINIYSKKELDMEMLNLLWWSQTSLDLLAFTRWVKNHSK